MKANAPLLYSALVLAFGLAGCGRPPEPAPPPRPLPVATPRPAPPAPPLQSNWLDRPASLGAWSWNRAAGQSQAVFSGNGAPLFALACDPARRTVALRLPAAAADAPVVITTTSGRRVLSGSPVLAANDPLLDAMAFSRGRFMVEATGAPPLYLPSAPEISRAIEDCR